MLARVLLALLFAVLVTLSCSQEILPAYGEVVLLLSTDMNVPDDFDTLVLERGKDTRWVFTVSNAATDQTSRSNPSDCGATNNPDSTVLTFPTTVVLKSKSDQPFPTELKLSACKNGRLVFARTFDVELPAPGEQKMLRAPIRWLCTNWTWGCYGCLDSDTVKPQKCHHDHIARLNEVKLCTTDACADPSDNLYKTVDYKPAEVAAYSASGAATAASCFDAWAAFGIGSGSQFATAQKWFHVPTQWQGVPGDSNQYDCEATIEPNLLDDRNLNLALVLPPGDQGVCDAHQCLIPLEARDPVGWEWRTREESNPINETPVVLPAAVCHMLDSGQILYVIGTTRQARKGYTTPYCSMISNPLPPTDESPLSGIEHLQFTLNDQNAWSAGGQGGPILQLHGGSIAETSTPIAVSNRAGRFTNKRYADSAEPLINGKTFTLSAWVSLTELTSTDAALTDIMPILSNVSADCDTGARLELRAQPDQASVELVLGIPVKRSATNVGQCEFRSTCAALASVSFAGGYFTPWKSGNFYHVAATFGSSGEAALYIDGVAAKTAGSCSQIAIVSEQPSDESRFYLGSSNAVVAFESTHPILIDEVFVSNSALSEVDIQRLSLYPSTVPGASGFRWGAWGAQGSHASMKATQPTVTFTVHDEAFGIAGSYALLGEALDLKNVTSAARTQELSGYDEAVLVADLPGGMPFQFSLVADHGRRQCTWQLFRESDDDADSREYSDRFVIDLRHPSWCVDPDCGFDLNHVERVVIGSDWGKSAADFGYGDFSYSVRSIAFRKRKRTSSRNQEQNRAARLGGIVRPKGWCWRPVSYDPHWIVGPIEEATAQAVTIPTPERKSIQSPLAPNEVPEVAADPPPLDDLGPLDLRQCKSVEIDAIWDDSAPTHKFVMTNAQGHSWDLDVANFSRRPARVELNVSEGGVWPPTDDELAARTDILRAVTRISLRSEKSLTVYGVKCCDENACQDLW